ncbi:MAG: ATP-binding protein [Actinobacteria bacterium]|nr:ATP-binding protein [Actinomycetota bacterium]
MDAFVGRDEQLTRLRDVLDDVRPTRAKPGRMLSIRGRRQVGKSTLVEEFIRTANTPAVFYVASRQSGERELALFSEAIATSGTDRAAQVARAGALGSWEAAFAVLAAEATRERPLIVVIDEFPYLVEKLPEIEGILQKAWDRDLEKAPILLLLIGSDVSMMEALAAYDRPLYGRFQELVVPPLPPGRIGEMLGLDAVATLDAYLMIGGFPRLPTIWRRGEGMWEMFARELENPTTPLAVLGERSLNAEFPANLNSRNVLAAIGAGERAFSAIETRAGIAGTSLARALETLEEKRIVAKVAPYSARAGGRPPRYVVVDSYLRFWLRFIDPNLELIQRGRGDVVAERVRQSWPDYRGRAIEPLVREAIERMLPDARFGGARFVGGFWTRDKRVEVDLVGGRGEVRSDMIDFVGSIKWRENAPFDRSDLAALVAARVAVPGATADAILVGVSRSGFTTADLDVEIGPEQLIAALG